MLYYYEKRNIDTLDEVVDSSKSILYYYTFYSNKYYNISSYAQYSVASYSKNGLYYTDRNAYGYALGTEFLVELDGRRALVTSPPGGMGFSYKIKVTQYSTDWSVTGILYKGTEAPGSLVSEFISEEGMYPDDGVQGDYWYVKKGRAINFKYKDINGIVYDIAEAKYKDVNGNIVDIASAIYKDNNGNILS